MTTWKSLGIDRPDKFLSICQPCIYKHSESGRFSMLTTYCITSSKCDLCGYLGDLAMVKDNDKFTEKNP